MSEAVIQGPEGEGSVSYLGTKVVFRVRGEQTGGRFATVEVWSPAGPSFGPPLHTDSHDEHFYILAGDVTFQSGGRRWQAAAGASLYVPSGVNHTFANLQPAPARMMVTFSPSEGFEHYFEELAALFQTTPPEQAQTAVRGLADKYGVVMIGPPITA